MSQKLKIIPNTLEVEIAGIPPTPSSQHLPKWYKDISPYGYGATKLHFPFEADTHNTTIKRCVPFLDAMTSGYTFVLDDDVFVEQVEGAPIMRWKSDATMITFHSPDQFQGLPIPKGYHNLVAKWHNDYVFKTPPGYSMLFTHPINRFDLPFLNITGVVDTDSFDLTTHFPFFLQEGFEGIIQSGTPVAQMIPLKRDSWKSTLEKYDEHESYKRRRMFRRTFAGSYKTNFWTKKSYS
jgi:hypothetical protein